jgi:uncharacterized protein
MPPEANPFSYGSPVRAQHFTDRREELADIVARMLGAQNVILLSPRRYGKTSLLFKAMDEVRRRKGRTGYVTLARCTDRREVAEAFLTGVVNGPLSWLSRRRRDLLDRLSRMRFRPEVVVGADGSLSVSVAAGAREPNWSEVMADALRLLSGAGEGGHPVSLVVDEFQVAAEIPPGLGGEFKAIADELSDVSLVFSGSREHVMRELAIGPGAPLLGMGEPMTLGIVPEGDMVDFLCRRSRAGGKVMTPEVARALFRAVDGLPNDVQRLAWISYGIAQDVIDEPVVALALQKAVRHQSSDFAERFQRLSPSQQRVLRELAQGPVSAVYAKAFLDAVKVANANAVRTALAALAGEELVVRRDGAWQVASPFLRTWLVDGTVDAPG